MFSLRSTRLEVVGERENGRARGRHAPAFSCAHYFQAPATQAMTCLVFNALLTTYMLMRFVINQFTANYGKDVRAMMTKGDDYD